MKIEKTPDHNFTGLESKKAEGRIHCSPHLIKYSAPKKSVLVDSLTPLPPPNVSKLNRCLMDQRERERQRERQRQRESETETETE